MTAVMSTIIEGVQVQAYPVLRVGIFTAYKAVLPLITVIRIIIKPPQVMLKALDSLEIMLVRIVGILSSGAEKFLA